MASTSVIEVSPERILYKDHLYQKENSKLKKLEVVLKQTVITDGSKVFNLNIKGVKKDKYHLQLDFTGQELCFLRLEELQDNMRGGSCFSCFDRNYYPSTVYSRLLMLLYSDPEDGTEAKCIKLPFIQQGNINAATSLHRLHDVLYSNVVSSGELKHWPVSVVRCGDLAVGERVFFCLTKYAMIVVLHYHILHYHTYFSSQMTLQCYSQRDEIEVTVHDKSLSEDSKGNENFSLYKTFRFKTAQCVNIEKSYHNLMRKSMALPHGPSAHFNIHHSEMSASVAPGTTSDNIMIIPHRSVWHDNNNSGSSSSNGHIPSEKIGNLVTLSETEFETKSTPQPHRPMIETQISVHHTASSNGSIPGSASMDDSLFPSDMRRVNNRPTDLQLQQRGSSGSGNETVKTAVTSSILVQARTSQPQKTVRTTPTAHTATSPIFDSAPGDKTHHPTSFHRKTPSEGHIDELDFAIDDMVFVDDFDETSPKFASLEEADSLPLPAPCPAFSLPFGEFPGKPPILRRSRVIPPEDDVPERRPRSRLLRSQSFLDLQDPEDIMMHMYVNIAQELSSRSSVHDDFPYYRFYYNVGLIGVMYGRMSKKLKRRNRLSSEMKNIDFNKLSDHEQWFDRDFKVRTKDLKFCHLYNIPPDSQDVCYNYLKMDKEDDPYWTKNDLCITIQRILEENPKDHRLFGEVQAALDLTAEQLMHVEVLLSMVPTENNWKMLAEYIGLDNSDVSIIEHFCYTYRYLAANVVFIQWMLRHRKAILGKQQDIPCPPCNHDSLLQFLDSHERNDIAMVMRNNKENNDTQLAKEILESTHF